MRFFMDLYENTHILRVGPRPRAGYFRTVEVVTPPPSRHLWLSVPIFLRDSIKKQLVWAVTEIKIVPEHLLCISLHLTRFLRFSLSFIWVFSWFRPQVHESTFLLTFSIPFRTVFGIICCQTYHMFLCNSDCVPGVHYQIIDRKMNSILHHLEKKHKF